MLDLSTLLTLIPGLIILVVLWIINALMDLRMHLILSAATDGCVAEKKETGKEVPFWFQNASLLLHIRFSKQVLVLWNYVHNGIMCSFYQIMNQAAALQYS